MGIGGGGFEILLALTLLYPELDANSQFATYASDSKWGVWARSRATLALVDIVQQLGLQRSEYGLRTGRIGGGTRLAAAGLLPAMISARRTLA